MCDILGIKYNFVNERKLESIFDTKKRKPVRKRDTTNDVVDNKPRTMKLCKNPRTINIYAYLLNDNTGKFINGDDDYFYKVLTDLSKQHWEYLSDVSDHKFYKKPFSDITFSFKNTKKFLELRDQNDMPISVEKCYNKKVALSLRVRPYEIPNKNVYGLVIKVSGAKLV